MYKKVDYNREYNKETYKTVKVYIREEDYINIINHMKKKGYTKLSGFIKDLINKDMRQDDESKQNIDDEKNSGGG